MNNRKLGLLLLAIGMSAVFFACSKHPGFKKGEGGLYYKFHEKGEDTTTMKEGMIMTLLMKYKINDSTLFNSADMSEPFMLPLEPPTYSGDIYAALAMMKPGDSASFITSADSFFLKTIRMPQLPDSNYIGKDIVFDIRLLSAMTREQMDEKNREEMAQLKETEAAKLAEYLSKNNITTAPLESGLYFTEKVKGSGQKPKDGDIVKIHFKVSDIDGRVFYSSFDQGDPMQWECGKTFDNEGATEALNMMSKGSEVSIIVPSQLGFGEQGRKPMVGPYTTLLYDIKMVSFQTRAQFDKEREEEQKKAEAEKLKAKAEEAGKIQSYIKNNNITVKPTASGLYYIETLKGTGESPVAGKTVKVHYTGTLL
ncbi:FKBP-type peptidyl-prolyl cis-trans isomerase, partial [Lentimicrobium sp.]